MMWPGRCDRSACHLVALRTTSLSRAFAISRGKSWSAAAHFLISSRAAATCSLASDPEMPPMLRNRAADNWRGLLAIADNLGHGEAARCAATKLASNRLDEDPGVVLLGNIGNLFQAWRVDRIASATLVEALLALDDSFWNEWRGPNDDRPPRKLTQGELARMLRPFEIRPRTIWSTQRGSGDNSRRGYLRSQFETAWRAYCPSADTPTQTSKIRHLPRS